MSILKPKLMGCENLDAALQEADCNEALFVVFSSVCASMGCAGTSSYGYANSAAERVCERRRACGLHGLAIQWGPIGDAGMIAGRSDITIPGTQPQTVLSSLSMLDSILSSSFPIVSCYTPWEKTREEVQEEAEASGEKTFKAAIAQILGLKNPRKLKKKLSLSRLGLDSMMSFELRHLLKEEYSITISPSDLPSITILELTEKIEATAADVHKQISPQSSATILPTAVQLKRTHEE